MQSSSQIITINKPTSSFLQAGCQLPVAQPTVSKHWREKKKINEFYIFLHKCIHIGQYTEAVSYRFHYEWWILACSCGRERTGNGGFLCSLQRISYTAGHLRYAGHFILSHPQIHIPCESKKQDPLLLPIISIDFQNSVTSSLGCKYVRNGSLEIAPHLKRVTILPCEKVRKLVTIWNIRLVDDKF